MSGMAPEPQRARIAGRSLTLSLRNIYETLAISVRTTVDSILEAPSLKANLSGPPSGAAGPPTIVDHLGIRLEVHGRENLGPGETYLVMSNHQSFYDIPVLFVVIGSNIRMIAKKELFHVPIFGKALAEGGLHRDRSAEPGGRLPEPAARQRPSGQRDPRVDRPRRYAEPDRPALAVQEGRAFYLALEAGLPILPVTLDGTRHALPTGSVRSVPGATVRVTIHPKVDPRPYSAQGKPGRDSLMTDVRRTLESAL